MDIENIIRLNEMYFDKLIDMTGKAVTAGNCDPVTIHVTAVKLKELYDDLKRKIKGTN